MQGSALVQGLTAWQNCAEILTRDGLRRAARAVAGGGCDHSAVQVKGVHAFTIVSGYLVSFCSHRFTVRKTQIRSSLVE
jgi:hypothetical protein